MKETKLHEEGALFHNLSYKSPYTNALVKSSRAKSLSFAPTGQSLPSLQRARSSLIGPVGQEAATQKLPLCGPKNQMELRPV